MRKRAGPLVEISLEFAEIIGRRDEKFKIQVELMHYLAIVLMKTAIPQGRTKNAPISFA